MPTTGIDLPAETPPFSLISEYPFGGAPATATATNLGTTAAYIVPFSFPADRMVGAVRIRTNAVLANCFEAAIFNSAGLRLWTSGTLSAVATGWVTASANLPLMIPSAALCYYGFVNKVTSTTVAYTVAPALGTASLPRWGTVATTAGTMPASITPSAITETTQYWPIYAYFSEFTT